MSDQPATDPQDIGPEDLSWMEPDVYDPGTDGTAESPPPESRAWTMTPLVPEGCTPAGGFVVKSGSLVVSSGNIGSLHRLYSREVLHAQNGEWRCFVCPDTSGQGTALICVAREAPTDGMWQPPFSVPALGGQVSISGTMDHLEGRPSVSMTSMHGDGKFSTYVSSDSRGLIVAMMMVPGDVSEWFNETPLTLPTVDRFPVACLPSCGCDHPPTQHDNGNCPYEPPALPPEAVHAHPRVHHQDERNLRPRTDPARFAMLVTTIGSTVVAARCFKCNRPLHDHPGTDCAEFEIPPDGSPGDFCWLHGCHLYAVPCRNCGRELWKHARMIKCLFDFTDFALPPSDEDFKRLHERDLVWRVYLPGDTED